MDSIGRYRLVRRIGAGSFATVWLGHDDDLDVPVAVKVLADNWASNSDVRNRFLAEARIMRRIHDRRLVQVYDIGTLDDGRPYFVMDYIDGGSMNDLRQQGVHPVRALRLCAEACRALDVLHGYDIIHRDVTPGNLLLSKTANGDTQVLIADLGVAKSMLDAVGATMTAGTPSYMAPEQAMGVAPLDRRADIYSLTAVTYAMLTGHPPFLVRSIADIPRPGGSAGLPALTAAGHREPSQFRQLVWDEPVDYATAGSPHALQAGVLLRPAGRLGARSLRHLDVHHHPGAPLRTSCPAGLGVNGVRIRCGSRRSAAK